MFVSSSLFCLSDAPLFNLILRWVGANLSQDFALVTSAAKLAFETYRDVCPLPGLASSFGFSNDLYSVGIVKLSFFIGRLCVIPLQSEKGLL